MKKLISFKSVCVLIFVFMPGCSTVPVDPVRTVEEKSVIPSKKNNITTINPKTYHVAYKNFYDRAVKGDPIAQNTLGHMYSDGRGVPEDSEEAVRWYTKAADQGNTAAMVNLGMSYLYGRGVSKSGKKACKYFIKAKLAGNREGKEFALEYCQKKAVV